MIKKSTDKYIIVAMQSTTINVEYFSLIARFKMTTVIKILEVN